MEVQGRHASTKNSISAGKTNSWQPRTTTTPPTRAPMPSQSNMSHANPANSVAKMIQKPTTSASSMASTGRIGDIQCLRCKGYGHVMHECPSKRVMIIKDDGECSSASDFDEDTLALLAADHAGSEEHFEEHINAAEADRYESLIV